MKANYERAIWEIHQRFDKEMFQDYRYSAAVINVTGDRLEGTSMPEELVIIDVIPIPNIEKQTVFVDMLTVPPQMFLSGRPEVVQRAENEVLRNRIPYVKVTGTPRGSMGGARAGIQFMWKG